MEGKRKLQLFLTSESLRGTKEIYQWSGETCNMKRKGKRTKGRERKGDKKEKGKGRKGEGERKGNGKVLCSNFLPIKTIHLRERFIKILYKAQEVPSAV